MKTKGRGGTGRAHVVGEHGAEMSESGYRISVVAMVWVVVEIVPARYGRRVWPARPSDQSLSNRSNPTPLHSLSATWQLRPSLTERWHTVRAVRAGKARPSHRPV